MSCCPRFWLGTLATLQVLAQDPTALMNAAQAKQGGDSMGMAAADATPRSTVAVPNKALPGEEAAQQIANDKADREIQRAKAKDKGPKRFAADLFDTRQYGLNPTDGGISEDYVLGVGDRLQMNVYGSATFDVPLQVDGRGSVSIPKVGSVPVAGLSLGRARTAVQNKVGQIFSRSTVDLSVTKLREVRVFVLGEVYRPGSFLVPSLSSMINVLSLSGGPTSIGSYRSIRILRGGKLIHSVDLYPLRAEGLGNLNFGFQNGDTLFVPLMQNQVRMEGAFTRVVATVPEKEAERETRPDTEQQKTIKRNIRRIEERLGLPLPFSSEEEPKAGEPQLTKEEKDEQWEEARLRFGANRQEAVLSSLKAQQNTAQSGPAFLSESAQLAALGMAQANPNSPVLGVSRGTAELLLPSERTELVQPGSAQGRAEGQQGGEGKERQAGGGAPRQHGTGGAAPVVQPVAGGWQGAGHAVRDAARRDGAECRRLRRGGRPPGLRRFGQPAPARPGRLPERHRCA